MSTTILNIILIGCGVLIYSFINRILIKDVAKREKYKPYIFWGVIIFVIGTSAFISSYGNTKIGSIFEKSEYRAKYYIFLFPEGNKTINYKLPALIYSNFVDDEDRSVRIYYLEKVFFPTGEILNFNEYNSDVFTKEEGLQIGKKISYRDDSGKYWEVELTDQKVEN